MKTAAEYSGNELKTSEAKFSEAGRRLIAYLRRLALPEIKRLETALTVLKKVSDVTEVNDPVIDSLDCMWSRVIDLPAPPPPCSAPPVQRTPMAPERMGSRKWLKWLNKLRRNPPVSSGLPPRPSKLPREYLNKPWGRVARVRRLFLMLLVLLPTVIATSQMASVLPHQGATSLEALLIAIFFLLFAWISVGFWTATVGFLGVLRRYDRFSISSSSHLHTPVKPDVRTAVVFPIYDEDIDRVCASLQACYESLSATGRQKFFDFYILSDTQNPDLWVEEETRWSALVERLNAQGQIFYRRRASNIKKKSGNIADFCRRHGSRYTYLVVMDADSVMTGQALIRMVSIMEHKRHVGILQTIPIVTGGETFLARAQGFANRLYTRMFAMGLHFWLLGDAQYWGHNAIIRVKPYLMHCALPRLPGKPPLGGDIISHDFVETALIRRAGWGVWLACDIEGSYEETPPTLLAELTRDRRWCKGNLQHLRLVFTRGIFPAHRALFLNGVMAYGSALLWLVFLLVSSVEAIIEAFAQPAYFPATKTLFPQWPVWEPWWALSLLASTGVILFLPKAYAFFLVILRGETRLFGGFFHLMASILLEILTSTLLAPVRMFFHSKFVFLTLLGQETHWIRQQREDRQTSWTEALRFHFLGTLVALLWGGMLFFLNRNFFYWTSPILISLGLSIPISVLTSHPGLGRWLKLHGFFLTPEEVAPPTVLRRLREIHEKTCKLSMPLGLPKRQGFRLAVVDPACLRLRIAQNRGPRRLKPSITERRQRLAALALSLGPDALSKEDKRELLRDSDVLSDLHRSVWKLPEKTFRSHWSVNLT